MNNINKRTLLTFSVLLAMTLSHSSYAAPNTKSNAKPAPKKIEIEDPLLEDDLFEESLLEEDEKVKSGPSDITIQNNTPVEENPIVEAPPPPPPESMPIAPIDNSQAAETEKPTELESSLEKQAELENLDNKIEEKNSVEESQSIESHAKNKMKGRENEIEATKPGPLHSKKSVEVLPRWNPRDPRKGFVSSDDDGYYYKEESDNSDAKEYGDDYKVKPKARNYANGLESVTSDGSYLYAIEESELEGSASIRVASMPPLPLVNKLGITYEDVYGNVPVTMALIDYDWLSFKSLGHWVLSVGTGFGTVDGPGRFIDNFEEAQEVYSLYVLLNHITFTYRFQYSKKPWFVPYVSLGAVPAILFERRDDDKRNKIAFSPSVHGSGGVRFNIGKLDTYGSGQLDAEYGINNMWLDVEFRRLQSFSEEIDISSNLINLGLGFDF